MSEEEGNILRSKRKKYLLGLHFEGLSPGKHEDGLGETLIACTKRIRLLYKSSVLIKYEQTEFGLVLASAVEGEARGSLFLRHIEAEINSLLAVRTALTC